jgi:integrase
MARPVPPPRLVKARNGVWRARWWDPVLRQGRTFSLGTKAKQEASALFAQWRVRTEDGTLLNGQVGVAVQADDPPPAARRDGGPFTVAAALDRYYEDHAKGLPSVGQARVAIRHLKAWAGEKPLREIRVPDCRAYVQARAQGAFSGRAAGPAASGRELSVLSAAARHCLKFDHCAQADMPRVELPAPPRDRVATEDELRRLFALARQVWDQRAGAWRDVRDDERLPRVYRFLAVVYYTGARRNAVETLRWDQVKLDRGLLHLNPEGRRQTRKRRPTVKIVKPLREVLERARREATTEWVLDHGGSIRASWETLRRRAEAPDLTRHAMRHTRVTRLLQSGLGVNKIAEMIDDRAEMLERKYRYHDLDLMRDQPRGLTAPGREGHGAHPPEPSSGA